MRRGPSKHEFEGPRCSHRRHEPGQPGPLDARNDVRIASQPRGLGCEVAQRVLAAAPMRSS